MTKQQTGGRDHLGALFVEITGRSTVTEVQRDDGGRRTVEPTGERYTQSLSVEDGLDDAVGTPENLDVY